jgi:hypothetical protein
MRILQKKNSRRVAGALALTCDGGESPGANPIWLEWKAGREKPRRANSLSMERSTLKENVSRRRFMRATGLGSIAALGTLTARSVPAKTSSAIKTAEAMKITKIEAVRFRPGLKIDGEAPVWMWVRLHTDNGLVGVGETYPFTEARLAF